jgi:tripartite-type tricarboxylate transporter receptor subunit TctC
MGEGSSCGLFAPKNTPADVIDRLNAISLKAEDF